MLMLKRMQYFNEFIECDASGEILMYGDFYYEDTETGKIISAKYYHEEKKKREEAEFDYSELEEAESEREYREELKKAEQEYLSQTMLDEYDRYTYSKEI